MAYDTYLAELIRQIFSDQRCTVIEKKMMGGLCFMLNNKMCCGIHFSKKKAIDLLMVRIGEEMAQEVSSREGCLPMDFTGRPMKGYIFVDPSGLDLDEDLNFWIDLCINFNTMAKASKKRKK
ncbi:MAG: TfoX/Sxy family protein [Flavobacteriales bacterium]|jgi:hypothetical protein